MVTGATVGRVLVENGTAVGIAYHARGRSRVALAGQEVVLCAGVIGSPHLLLLSGIGAPDMLRRAGVTPIVALPGVGRNLQDHASVALRFASKDARTLHHLIRLDRAAIAMARAIVSRDGPATEFPVEAGGFTRSRPGASLPDLQWYFNLGLDVSRLRVPGLWPWRSGTFDREGFSIVIALLRPESRGSVVLRSGDPNDPPLLYSGYLDNAADRAALRAGVRQARSIAAEEPLVRHVVSELSPSPAITDDDGLDAWIRGSVGSANHMAGTCRMGVDAEAVVDARLRVHGLDRLRVADASVVPVIPSGGTYAPAVMIAERCADFVLGKPALPRLHAWRDARSQAPSDICRRTA